MRARLPVLALVGWTLFVWVTRMNNILRDDGLEGFGLVWRFGAAVLFVLLAGAVLWSSWRDRRRFAATLAGLVVFTTAWWAVRGLGILLDDHGVGFKVVHTVLMLVSIGLAMWAWRRRAG